MTIPCINKIEVNVDSRIKEEVRRMLPQMRSAAVSVGLNYGQ
jgi:hypothetical protein